MEIFADVIAVAGFSSRLPGKSKLVIARPKTRECEFIKPKFESLFGGFAVEWQQFQKTTAMLIRKPLKPHR